MARSHMSLAAVVVVWAGSFSVIKALLDHGIAAGDIAVLRYAIAAPGFALVLWRSRGLPGLTRSDALRVAAAGILVVLGYHISLNVGESHTTSGIAALVVALAPGMTLVLAVVLGIERLVPRRALGLAIAFAGVAVVVALGTGEELSLRSVEGPLIVLAAPFSFALYNVILKPLLARHDLLALTAASSLAGTLALVPFVRPSTVDTVSRISATDALLVVYLGLLATLLGYIGWNIGLRGLGPTRAVAYTYAISPLAVVIGTITLDEKLTPWLVVGAVLVVVGIATAQGTALHGRLRRVASVLRMVERTLTTRDLNRALLARQLLLERARLPIPRVLERMGGLQAQYAPSMYVGLWSRVDGFERAHLTRLLGRRNVVQGTLMRATIHLVSTRDYWPFALGIREARRQWWLRVHRPRPDPRELAAAARRLRRRLADGPLRRAEIDELIGGGAVWTNGIGLWIDLVRVPPSGTWEHRRADLYAAAEEWIGPAGSTADEGAELLVRRYLGGFGPATRAEIAEFAGLPARDVEHALARLQVRRFRAEDGAELLDLPRAPLPDPETPAPVRFLPVWDATLLVHARRTGILPERHRPRIFNTKTPQSTATFLVGGEVAGSWNYEAGRVTVSPFERLDASVRRAVRAETERLEALHS